MKIYAIRHTSVNVNPGICYGQTDVEVAGSFFDERQKTAYEISDIKFDEIWSSPLKRCKKLVQSLFPENQIKYDQRLKELNFGEWEMLSWDEIYARPEGKVWMNNFAQLLKSPQNIAGVTS